MAVDTNCFLDPEVVELLGKRGYEKLLTLDSIEAQDFIDKIVDSVKLDKKQKYLQAVALKQLVEEMPEKPKDVQRWLNTLIGQDKTVLSTRMSLENKAKAIRTGYQREMVDLMNEFRPGKFGMKTQTEIHESFVRALFGEKNDMGSMVKLWEKVSNDLHERFNKAGGGISLRKDWRMPTTHLPRKVNQVPFEDWSPFIMDRLDYKAMGITREDLSEFIRDIYDSISTDGASNIEPGMIPTSARGKIGNRHRDARFFEFKNADAWLEYHEKFGNDNVYVTMMDHVNGMSNEIAAMESLGPNPERTMGYLKDLGIKSTLDKGVGNRMEKQWSQFIGGTAAKGNFENATAHWSSSVRNAMTAVHLGSATLSSMPDIWFSKMAARYNGIPLNAMQGIIKNLTTAITNPKELSRLSGDMYAGMEHAIDAAHQAIRYVDIVGAGPAARAAEVVMRTSGLNVWTVALRQMNAQAYMLHLTRGKFNKANKAMFKRYGVTDADLKALREAPRRTAHGRKYADLEAMPRENREKFVGMLQGELIMAVPEQDIVSRAFVTQGQRQGTVSGEMLRHMGQFKGFSTHVLISQMERAFRGAGLKDQLSYGGHMVAGLTILGTLAIQLKELAAGKEPIDWENPELWKRGFFQGGSLPIISETFLQDPGRYGQSIQKFLLGPAASDVNDYFIKNMFGPVVGDTEWKEVPEALLKGTGEAAQKLNPLSNMWMLRAVMDRSINQGIKEFTDPNWKKNQRRREKKRMEKTGNPYWYQLPN